MIIKILLLLFAFNVYGQYEVPLLFEHPRDGNFKWAQNEQFNGSTMIHGIGAFMGTVITSAIYKKFDVTDKPAFYGAATIWGLGLLKETEDGFREGFGRTDLYANTIGCGVGYGLFAVLNHYRSKKIKIEVFNKRIYLTVIL